MAAAAVLSHLDTFVEQVEPAQAVLRGAMMAAGKYTPATMKVAVLGARGKVGSEVCRAVELVPRDDLLASVRRLHVGHEQKAVGERAGGPPLVLRGSLRSRLRMTIGRRRSPRQSPAPPHADPWRV